MKMKIWRETNDDYEIWYIGSNILYIFWNEMKKMKYEVMKKQRRNDREIMIYDSEENNDKYRND